MTVDADFGVVPDVPRERVIAGFWRRVGAIVIDLLVLGAIGAFIGFFWFKELAAIGSSARLIGGAIALAYVALLNSRLAGGRTVGKRLLRLQVVNVHGDTIPLSRSAIRGLVLVTPMTLNGFYFSSEVSTQLISTLLSVCVFGAGGSIIYLYLFNRRTRQSLHDIIARAFVVTADTSGGVQQRIWKPHLAIVGAWILAVAIAINPLADRVERSETFEELRQIQEVAQTAVPGAAVSVNKGASKFFSTRGGASVTDFVKVQVYLSQRPDSYEEIADQIVSAIFVQRPRGLDVSHLSISVTYGFDMMIWRMSTTQRFSRTVSEWKERLRFLRKESSAA